MTNESAATKHAGGCHCGRVRYQAIVDTRHATACNCTVCTKLAMLGAIIKPEAFELLSDETTLASYSRRPDVANRFFCAHCHVFCFGKGHLAELGGDFVSINLNTIDDFDPSLTTIVYWDGRHDNWGAGPRPMPWPVSA